MKARCKIFIAAILSWGIATSVKACSGNIKISKPPIINYEQYDIEGNPVFATYEDGEIYIVDKDNDIEHDANDIVIVDLRDVKEDMQVISSYRIEDIPSQLKIIDLILEYNELFPSDTPWDRSKNSMLNEWLAHNVAYLLNYERQSSESVDFQNQEEDQYDIIKLIKKPK